MIESDLRGKCFTCRHWDGGGCERIGYVSRRSDGRQLDASGLIQISPDDDFIDVDVFTERDFGCVLHEARLDWDALTDEQRASLRGYQAWAGSGWRGYLAKDWKKAGSTDKRSPDFIHFPGAWAPLCELRDEYQDCFLLPEPEVSK